MITSAKAFLRKILRRPAPSPAPGAPPASAAPDFLTRKARKLERVRPILRDDLPLHRTELFYDFLSDDLRRQFHIVDTDNVSAHQYDGHSLKIIEELAGGLILDCGAGLRGVYYDNVVNLEICAYDTTDVRGVGEVLPFRSASFDAVFSFNVLEHVRDPFACAREIVRVLKPGARLYSVVPFLQQYHGYPHHYYNMTAQGLRNLFADDLVIDHQEVNTGGHPVFMLAWVLRTWAEALPPAARRDFLQKRVSDLTGDPMGYLEQPWVAEMPEECRFELACTTSLFAHKPPDGTKPPGE